MRATNFVRRNSLRAALRLLPSDSALHRRLVHATLATDVGTVKSFRAVTHSGQCVRLSDPAHSVVARKVYWFGAHNYEPGTSRIIEQAAARANVFLDIGANIGFYSLLAAAANPRLRVFAFEPAPQTCRQLTENVALNRMMVVEPIQAAVGDIVGQTSLFLSDNDCSASIRAGFRDPQGEVQVPVTTIDQFAENRGIDRIDLIKLDVEGVEDRVLLGAQRVLRDHRPTIICEVLAGRTESRLQAIIDAHGYEYSLITSHGPVCRNAIEGDPTYVNLNYLFTPKDTAPMRSSASS